MDEADTPLSSFMNPFVNAVAMPALNFACEI